MSKGERQLTDKSIKIPIIVDFVSTHVSFQPEVSYSVQYSGVLRFIYIDCSTNLRPEPFFSHTHPQSLPTGYLICVLRKSTSILPDTPSVCNRYSIYKRTLTYKRKLRLEHTQMDCKYLCYPFPDSSHYIKILTCIH